MKFHFFTSLFLLVAAGFMVILGLFDPEIFLYAAIVEFILGIQQIISSLVALIVLESKSYFLKHLGFSVVFILFFIALSWFEVSDHIKWPFVFSVPWVMAIYHTYRLHKTSETA